MLSEPVFSASHKYLKISQAKTLLCRNLKRSPEPISLLARAISSKSITGNWTQPPKSETLFIPLKTHSCNKCSRQVNISRKFKQDVSLFIWSFLIKLCKILQLGGGSDKLSLLSLLLI